MQRRAENAAPCSGGAQQAQKQCAASFTMVCGEPSNANLVQRQNANETVHHANPRANQQDPSHNAPSEWRRAKRELTYYVHLRGAAEMRQECAAVCAAQRRAGAVVRTRTRKYGVQYQTSRERVNHGGVIVRVSTCAAAKRDPNAAWFVARR